MKQLERNGYKVEFFESSTNMRDHLTNGPIEVQPITPFVLDNQILLG